MTEISPIEHAVMWMGVYEFQHCLDVPWRVVLNECIELAKGIWRHRRPQVCQWRARRPGPKLRADEVAADKAGTPAG